MRRRKVCALGAENLGRTELKGPAWLWALLLATSGTAALLLALFGALWAALLLSAGEGDLASRLWAPAIILGGPIACGLTARFGWRAVRTLSARDLMIANIAAVIALAVYGIAWIIEDFERSRFERTCRRIAAIEVRDEQLWLRYLAERRHQATTFRVTIDGHEIDPTDLSPVRTTTSFASKDDYALHGGRREKDVIYRNDQYVFEKQTGKLAARFRDLEETTSGWDSSYTQSCTGAYAHLYTGRPPRRGTMRLYDRDWR